MSHLPTIYIVCFNSVSVSDSISVSVSHEIPLTVELQSNKYCCLMWRFRPIQNSVGNSQHELKISCYNFQLELRPGLEASKWSGRCDGLVWCEYTLCPWKAVETWTRSSGSISMTPGAPPKMIQPCSAMLRVIFWYPTFMTLINCSLWSSANRLVAMDAAIGSNEDIFLFRN